MNGLHETGDAAPHRTADMLPGFADPVNSSQRVFKSVLTAMSFPGRVVELRDLVPAPAPMSADLTAVVLALADMDTPLWLDAAGQSSSRLTDFLSFHTGAPLVSSPSDASFGVVTDPSALPPLDHFPQGSDEEPDKSATVIIQVNGFDNGPVWTLTGPGIDGERDVQIDGLPESFAQDCQANHHRFPKGVDIVLVQGGQIVALPRTTWLRPRTGQETEAEGY